MKETAIAFFTILSTIALTRIVLSGQSNTVDVIKAAGGFVKDSIGVAVGSDTRV